MFTAAIVPGPLPGGVYILYILVRVRLKPALAPLPLSSGPPLPLARKLLASRGLFGPVLLATMVLGSIYGGITSITEAATMGVVGVLALIVLRGEFRPALLREAFEQTFRSVGILLWVPSAPRRRSAPTPWPAGRAGSALRSPASKSHRS